MREITFGSAIREGLREEMLRDNNVYLILQETNSPGAFPAISKGLSKEFGSQRVVEANSSVSAMIGSGIGSCIVGLRPVVEVACGGFLTCAMDLIVNYAARMTYAYGGEVSCPIVIRTAFGYGPKLSGDPDNAQNFEAWFAHVPGLKVVLPSTPYDAKGLLKACIRDNNPVLFFEHRSFYDMLKAPVPEKEYTVPLGKADVKREGKDVTVIATGAMIHNALTAADKMAEEGVSVEVVDPRTLRPLDVDTLVRSVHKTGRCVIVHEAWTTGGIGAEIAATIADRAFGFLKSPIKRVGAVETPCPASPILKRAYLPDEDKIVFAVQQVLEMETSPQK
jgi:pyruvate dehydrogenase E1 component beta subunit